MSRAFKTLGFMVTAFSMAACFISLAFVYQRKEMDFIFLPVTLTKFFEPIAAERLK